MIFLFSFVSKIENSLEKLLNCHQNSMSTIEGKWNSIDILIELTEKYSAKVLTFGNIVETKTKKKDNNIMIILCTELYLKTKLDLY